MTSDEYLFVYRLGPIEEEAAKRALEHMPAPPSMPRRRQAPAAIDLNAIGAGLIVPQSLNIATNLEMPPTFFTPQGHVLDISAFNQLVNSNKFLTYDEAERYLERRLIEKLPGARRFDLTGQVWNAGDGKLSFMVGPAVAYDTMTSSLQGGNTVNPLQAGLDLILTLNGKIVDHFTDTIGKHIALYQGMTMRDYEAFLKSQSCGLTKPARNLLRWQ